MWKLGYWIDIIRSEVPSLLGTFQYHISAVGSRWLCIVHRSVAYSTRWEAEESFLIRVAVGSMTRGTSLDSQRCPRAITLSRIMVWPDSPIRYVDRKTVSVFVCVDCPALGAKRPSAGSRGWQWKEAGCWRESSGFGCFVRIASSEEALPCKKMPGCLISIDSHKQTLRHWSRRSALVFMISMHPN